MAENTYPHDWIIASINMTWRNKLDPANAPKLFDGKYGPVRANPARCWMNRVMPFEEFVADIHKGYAFAGHFKNRKGDYDEHDVNPQFGGREDLYWEPRKTPP